ncbi:hypothetical protein GF345_00175, partial [Candidatus Woesearchaeota archaeon]|nr:hypothetical protein [Candidatus Woesearchaeota archaeon]
DGHIEVNGKKITIPSVCLEEEACQIIQRTKDKDIYNLSRLGIPLIEIATGPDITTPEECRDTAAKLGMILRSVEGMKRGVGTIRQDVNMSLKGGERVEVKGFQEYKSIPKVIEKETRRHLDIIRSGRKMKPEVRKAEPDFTTTFLRPMPGAARMYPETDIRTVKPDLEGLEDVELIEDRAGKLEKLGLSKDLAMKVTKTGKADLISGFLEKFRKIKPAFIADTILSYASELKDKDTSKISDKDLKDIFKALDESRIAKDSVMNILEDIASGNGLNLDNYAMMPDADIEAEVKKIVEANKDKPEKQLIGIAMGKLKGKADAKKVVEILKNNI